MTKFVDAASMELVTHADFDATRIVEAAISDPETPLEMVDVGKLLRFFGFAFIHTDETFTFFNLEEQVAFDVNVAAWRDHPQPTVVHLGQAVSSWLVDRRAQGLDAFEIDLSTFDDLMVLDRRLRRRLEPYIR